LPRATTGWCQRDGLASPGKRTTCIRSRVHRMRATRPRAARRATAVESPPMARSHAGKVTMTLPPPSRTVDSFIDPGGSGRARGTQRIGTDSGTRFARFTVNEPRSAPSDQPLG
jgi:hypothetical protein